MTVDLARGQRRASIAPGQCWLLVVLITLAVFAPELRNDFVDWDDLNMIVHNPRFNPPTWIGAGWYWVHPAWNLYQPMTTTLWAGLAWVGWVQTPDQFGGHMNPLWFHLASVILHALSAGFLWQILNRALRNQTAAFIGVLVFALHPLQVEPVAFAGAMNGPLSGCLLLLALWLYLTSVDPKSDLPRLSRQICSVISFAALLLAMFARPSAVVGGPIALLLDLATFGRPVGKTLRSIVPWTVLSVACVIWTHQFQHGELVGDSPVWFRPIVASDAVLFYIRKILLPIHLCIEYDRTPASIRHIPFIAAAPLVPLTLIAVVIFFWRNKPLLSAGVLIFLIALLPSSGLVPFDWERVSTVSDRYASLSLIGAGLTVGVFVKSIGRLLIPAVVMLTCLTAVAECQITTWQNSQTLYRHVLSINSDAWYSAGNLAYAIADQSP